MSNTNTDLQRQIEERIRIVKMKKETRACKVRLYEIAAEERNQK